MEIRNRTSRKVLEYNLRVMQDFDQCCTVWPSGEGVIDFSGEKIYFTENQDLQVKDRDKDEREVLVRGYLVKRDTTSGLTTYLSIEKDDLTREEQAELISKIKGVGFANARVVFPWGA